MPSRFGVAVIALFWLATTGFVAYRDLLPHYLADGPPPIRIEMTDEATAQIPAKWALYWDQGDGPKKVGGASTELAYEPADDTFWFKSEYRDLRFDVGGWLIALPNVLSDVRVSRTGALREQRFAGDLAVSRAVVLPNPIKASALVGGRVEDGVLTGRCRVWTEHFTRQPVPWTGRPEPPVVDRPLDPVPVPDGQVLNPMMPLAKLRGVRPGRTWVIREVNPLAEAIAAMLRDAAKGANLSMLTGASGGSDGPRQFIARVRSSPEEVTLIPPAGTGLAPRDPVTCWVIDYDGGGGVRAVTWVGVADGTVYRQQAKLFSETLQFEREY